MAKISRSLTQSSVTLLSPMCIHSRFSNPGVSLEMVWFVVVVVLFCQVQGEVGPVLLPPISIPHPMPCFQRRVTNQALASHTWHCIHG